VTEFSFLGELTLSKFNSYRWTAVSDQSSVFYWSWERKNRISAWQLNITVHEMSYTLSMEVKISHW